MKTPSVLTSEQVDRPKALHIALWIAQVGLAGMFLMAGFMKAAQPIDQLAAAIPFAKENPLLTRFIGISELLAVLGLILPAALRIKPQLTVWAAYGLTLVMLLATIFHLVRNEVPAIGITIILGLVAAFVAWGRATKAPIYPKA